MQNNSDQTEETQREDIRTRVAQHLRSALELLGCTEARDKHLEQTPENLTDFWLEFFDSYLNQNSSPSISTFPAEEISSQFIMITDLPYYSLCVHHLTPFWGMAHIAYVPNKLAMGIGAPAKLLKHYSKRPQLQERLATQLADQIIEACDPQGVMILLTARQMCMEMRGAKSTGKIKCSIVRGCFNKIEWQNKFFDGIKS